MQQVCSLITTLLLQSFSPHISSNLLLMPHSLFHALGPNLLDHCIYLILLVDVTIHYVLMLLEEQQMCIIITPSHHLCSPTALYSKKSSVTNQKLGGRTFLLGCCIALTFFMTMLSTRRWSWTGTQEVVGLALI